MVNLPCPDRRALESWKILTIRLIMIVNTLVFVPVFLLACLILKQRQRIVFGRNWSKFNILSLKKIAGIEIKIEGLEHVPDYPVIIASNHQSMLETMVLQLVLDPYVWVLKKELFRIPLFGWGLAAIGPIAIDRKQGKTAMAQIVEQGNQKFKEGLSVLIFPEGTRIDVGVRRGFKSGVAVLAKKTGKEILPIAHNCGCVWPGKKFLKFKKQVTFRIGQPIPVENQSQDEVLEACQSWIFNQLDELEA